MDVQVEGYGYSFRQSTSAGICILILLVQTGIALTFIVWSVVTGTTSSSWDAPAELIALAFASEVPRHREGLATGEASINLLKKHYTVSVSKGKRLQLKEWNGEQIREENRVKPNVAYE